jgi:hypothetical protein
MRILLATAILSLSNLHAQSDTWKPFHFLIGEWEAKTTAGPAQSSGSYAFQLELRNHVLVRRSATKDCKGPNDFNCEHGDILYIYREGAAFKAIYFDNEGHVIHYNIATSSNSAIFLSDDPGPQFRLTYELKDGVMSGKFQIKPPGQTEFKSYLEWSGGKSSSR